MAVVKPYTGEVLVEYTLHFMVYCKYLGDFQMRQDIIIGFACFFLSVRQAIERMGFLFPETL